MLSLVVLSFLLSAMLYAALGLWRSSIGGFRGSALLLGASFAGMAAWSLGTLVLGGALPIVLEQLRNVLWIAYLGYLLRRDPAAIPHDWLAVLPALLIALGAARAVLAVVFLWSMPGASWALLVGLGCNLAFCIGALIFLHSLYLASDQGASGFRLVVLALAVLWAYDLNFYAAVLLAFRLPAELANYRGVLVLALAPVFGIAARRKERWSLGLSRKVAFQSLSLVAIGGYFVFVSTIASIRPWLGDKIGAAGQLLALVLLAAVTAGLLSPRVRSRVKVFISRHLFKHRYDYPTEWLRFSATINSGRLTGLTPEQRAVKALVDLMETAGGVLFLRTAHDRLECAATFEWPGRSPAEGGLMLSAALLDRIEEDSHVLINPCHTAEPDGAEFPSELRIDDRVWAAVPLVRTRGLLGLVALGKPGMPRELDWEDFDLLKVLGHQIATYLADAQSQAELEEARQFEEFNRRFAFIVHDIKNVVSQLSLVAANAVEHGANPRFQADMASTLHNSVGKMTTLLSRLSLDQYDADVALDEVDAVDVLSEIAAARRAQHPVSIAPGARVGILADRDRLHTAIDHLVQNAIEASAPTSPVLLSARATDGVGIISVLDTGSGMSGDYVRRHLFKPFASTKPAGFGIGAGEARTLVRQMGGELEVQSVEGVGTSFLIKLPIARPQRETAM